MKTTITALLCIISILSFGQVKLHNENEGMLNQSDSIYRFPAGKIITGAYDERGNLVWDSSITTSIGERFFRFQAKDISQDGIFSIQVYSNDGSLAQYTFYNWYRLRDEFWWQGRKVDDSKYDKIYRYFKLKK